MLYDLSVVRKLIAAALEDEDLNILCLDHFPAVYEQFTVGQTKGQRVQLLIDHARRNGLLDELLDKVRQANPYQYAEFEPRLEAIPKHELETQVDLWLEPVPAVPRFVGRAAALAAYREELARTRFVIIKGMAGVGKTTLGAKLAREATEQEEQILWFTFDQLGKNTLEAVFQALAVFLESQGRPRLLQYVRGEIDSHKPLEMNAKMHLLLAGLASGDYVLCFDDIQEVKDAPDVLHFFELLGKRSRGRQQALPAWFILMGREVSSEMEYLVAENLNGFTEEEARLFVEDQNLTLPLALMQRLWERTEGNPELLKLSVSVLTSRDGNQARMERFVETIARKGDVRDYVMSEIYTALEPEEQRVAGVLSIFSTPVESKVAEEILSADGVTGISSLVYALENRSVVTETEDNRIHCHSLVREYCYQILDREDKEQLHQWAADCYEEAGRYLAAAHHHFQRGAHGQALDLLTAQTQTIINAGEAGALLEQLAQLEWRKLNSEQRRALCQARGDAYEMRGRYQQALAAYEAALEETTGEESRAELLHRIGFTHRQSGEYGTAIEYLTQGLSISESLGNQDAVADVHHDIGWSYYRMRRLEKARQHFAASQRMGQESGDRLLLAKAGLGLGTVNWKEGRSEEARALFEKSRRVFGNLGHRRREAEAVGNLGLICGEMGELEQELSHHRQAAEILEEIGGVDGLCIAYNNLGNLHHLAEDYGQAVHYYNELARLARDSDQKPMLSTACSGMADAHLALGDPQQALECAQEARRVAQEASSGVDLGISCRALGDIWLALEDPAQAKDCFEQGIPLLEEAEEDQELTKARHGLERALGRVRSGIDS